MLLSIVPLNQKSKNLVRTNQELKKKTGREGISKNKQERCSERRKARRRVHFCTGSTERLARSGGQNGQEEGIWWDEGKRCAWIRSLPQSATTILSSLSTVTPNGL
jgi:hypothetical protein